MLRLVVRLGLRVERHGDELRALCPNPEHDDRDPSWSINVRTGSHGCWSCGWGGSPGDLAAAVVGSSLAWDWSDGWKWIEARGLLLGGDENALDVELELVGAETKRLVMPWGVVQDESLGDWPTPIRRYAESRGLTREQVATWRIGFAVHGKVAGRIVIPVYDAAERLASWTARSYDGSEPRYLTPKEADGPDPGAIFGECEWPSLSTRQTVVIVEGALDALAVDRAVGGAVAGLLGAARVRTEGGTGSSMQLAKLATFARAVVLTDSDPAGDRAWEELRAGLGRHCRVERARLPDGVDATDAGPEAVRRVLRC